MSKLSYIAVLAGTVMLSSPICASASTFNFNTTNFGLSGSSTVDSASMAVDGVTVTLTAFSISNDNSGTISNKTQLTNGTGVYVSGSSNNVGVRSNLTGDGTNMDGGNVGSTSDLDEGILFTFSEVVTLDFINFDSFGASDDFNMTVDEVSILVDHNSSDGDIPGVVSNASASDHFNFYVTGQEFLIWADGNSDSFRIDSVNATVVPVPATVWLFGSCLLGLFSVARRGGRGQINSAFKIS